MKQCIVILILLITTISATPQDSIATKKIVDSLLNDPEFKKGIDALDCLLKASMAISKSNYFEASKQVELALALDPTFGRSYLVRANLSFKQKRFTKALKDLNTAISFDPQLLAAYEKRGMVYALMEEFDKAIDDYNSAISLKPGYYKSYLLRAKVYESLGQFEKAISDNKKIEGLTSLKGAHAEANFNLSNIYLSQKQYAEAVIYGKKSVAQDYRKRFTHAYILCGKAYEAEGNKSSAIEVYNKYIFHEQRKSHIDKVKETIERVKSLGGIPKNSSLLR